MAFELKTNNGTLAGLLHVVDSVAKKTYPSVFDSFKNICLERIVKQRGGEALTHIFNAPVLLVLLFFFPTLEPPGGISKTTIETIMHIYARTRVNATVIVFVTVIARGRRM